MPANRVASAFLTFSATAPAPAHQPRLYCFAYAGGAASVYAPWARALAPQIAVLGVELPGHGSRFQETPHESVAKMSAGIAEAIASEDSDAPFAFYGHSLGAVVAFETAQLLAQRGPAHLFIGAARAPHLPPTVPAISHLPSMEFLQAVQERYGGLPAALFEEPELLELVLPVLRADFKAYEGYRCPEPRALNCPVTAFHGATDPVVRGAAVHEWALVTSHAFQMETLPGDHFFLNTNREALLAHIRQRIGEHAGLHSNVAALG